MRKRAKYIERCKDMAWQRWTTEYLKALRENHDLRHKNTEIKIAVGDVVLIKGDEKNRGKWNIGIVKQLNKGRDGIVRSAKLRAGKSTLERALQHLYPMELSIQEENFNKSTLDPKVPEYRPKRDAAVAAKVRISEVTHHENELPVIE